MVGASGRNDRILYAWVLSELYQKRRRRVDGGFAGCTCRRDPFRSIYHIAARSFYAQQDTRTPLYISIFAISLNIFLAIWFTSTLDMGAYGLAWAQSIVAFVEVMILFYVMSRRIKGLFDRVFMGAVMRMASATGFMAVISYISVLLFQLGAQDQSFLATFPKFGAIVVINIAAYLLFSKMLKLPEVNPVLARLRKLLFGRAAQN
jgi:putative peptidoglycan lipid II flippase